MLSLFVCREIEVKRKKIHSGNSSKNKKSTLGLLVLFSFYQILTNSNKPNSTYWRRTVNYFALLASKQENTIQNSGSHNFATFSQNPNRKQYFQWYLSSESFNGLLGRRRPNGVVLVLLRQRSIAVELLRARYTRQHPRNYHPSFRSEGFVQLERSSSGSERLV